MSDAVTIGNSERCDGMNDGHLDQIVVCRMGTLARPVFAIPRAVTNEALASRTPSGCGFLIAAGNPQPDGMRLA